MEGAEVAVAVEAAGGWDLLAGLFLDQVLR